MSRRIAVQWHKNGKALDVVVDAAHMTLAASEVESLVRQGQQALDHPPSNAVMDIDAARAKLKR